MPSRPLIALVLLGCSPFLHSPLAAAAQDGFVRSAGQPIPGAVVDATQGDVHLTTTTGDDGRYHFDDLAPGVWKVQVQMFGFQTAQSDVTIGAAGGTKDWTLDLKPRAAARQPGGRNAGFQSVTLAQRANMTDLQNLVNSSPEQQAAVAGATENSGDSFVVQGSVSRGLTDTRQDDAFGRARMDMQQGPGGDSANGANGAPGFGGAVTPSLLGGGGPGGGGPGGGGPGGGGGGRGGGGGGGGFGGGGGGFGGGGGGFRGGGDRQGGGRGGRQADAMARNGTFGNRAGRNRNNFRGMAFFTLRNSALDAAPFSFTGQNVGKPSYAQSRFGVSGGGALNIPKVIKSDKTFFFFNYSGGLGRNPVDYVATVPSLLERSGDFSHSVANGPVTIFDPVSHQPFAGNLIPQSQQSSIALGLLKYFPLSNQNGSIQNFRFVTSVPQNTQSLGLRMNQTISAKDRLDGSFNLQKRDGRNAQVYEFLDSTNGSGVNLSLGYTHNFTARTLGNVHFNFSRNRNETNPFFANGPNVAAQLGIVGTSSDPINFGPPNLTFTNYGSLSDASPSLIRNQTAGVTAGFTLIRGTHNISFGGEFRRMQFNTKTDQNGRGTYSFSGLATSQFDAQGQPVASTGFDFADFLLGDVQASSIRYGSNSNYFRGAVYNAYSQDDWKVGARLTLLLGLRYEYFTPFYEKNDRLANLDIAPSFSAVAVVTPGATGPYSGKFPRALINPDANNFSPRLGIAWKPRSGKSLLVRAGYGIYYNGSVFTQFPSLLASQPPFANSLSVTTSSLLPLDIQTGFTQVASQSIRNTYAIDRNYKTGYAQTWNASVQQNLPASFVLELGYVGTKGTRLDLLREPNRAAPGSPLSAEQRRQIANAVGFTFESSDANSIYHAANVRLMRRFRGGISGNLTYTLSKSIDDASTFGGAGNSVVQNDLDIAAERGLSSFDHRHSLALGYVLTSPVGQNGAMHTEGAWLNRLFSDWMITGNVTARSGTPLTARVLGNQTNIGGTGSVGSGRADATGLPVESGGGFFNPLAFTIPAPGTFGNAGRNTIPGPFFVGANLGLSRSFRLGEDRRRMEFRVDATNFTNSVNIANFGTIVNASNYGLATSAAGMRTLSSTVRFRF